MTMSVTIRSAALDDIPIILAIERQSPSAAHWTAEQYHKLVGDGVVLFAECAPSAGQERKEQGSPCGFICAKAVAGEWEIENVVVAAEFLRRGVADELMRGLIQRARNEGASSMLLEVREANGPARGLYRKHGFRESGRRRMYYNAPSEDAILYTLVFDR